MDVSLIEDLRRKRIRLWQSYITHVGWFILGIVFIYFDTLHISIVSSILLTLITIPPVFYYTVSVSKVCRRIDPSVKPAGVKEIVIISLVFTPLEAALVYPAKNLLISRRILKEHGAIK